MVGESGPDEDIADVFYFYLSDAVHGELDFLGREVPARHGYSSIDVLGIDIDRPYAELVRVKTSSYEAEMARIAELEHGWEYAQPRNTDVSVDRDVRKGHYYMNERAASSPVLESFFDAVLEVDVFEKLEPVDTESLDL